MAESPRPAPSRSRRDPSRLRGSGAPLPARRTLPSSVLPDLADSATADLEEAWRSAARAPTVERGVAAASDDDGAASERGVAPSVVARPPALPSALRA